MGLTSKSTGTSILEGDLLEKNIPHDYTIAISGNPNVGKSTIFNALTGMHQHTRELAWKNCFECNWDLPFPKKRFSIGRYSRYLFNYV